jgi:hypothetical protein
VPLLEVEQLAARRVEQQGLAHPLVVDVGAARPLDQVLRLLLGREQQVVRGEGVRPFSEGVE